jgi:hypothetical protein
MGLNELITDAESLGNRQIISIRGVSQNNYNATDPWVNTLKIFDMTELTWGFNYDAGAALYYLSQPVVDYYANTSNWYPTAWSDPALKSTFGIFVTTNAANPTPPPSSSSSSNNGAIAGGVVGGVIAIAIAAVLIFLLRRKTAHGEAVATDPKYNDVPQDMDNGMVPGMGEGSQVHELRAAMLHPGPAELQA